MDSEATISKVSTSPTRSVKASAFDCDPTSFETMAFGAPLRAPEGRMYRADSANAGRASKHISRNEPIVYAPIEVVPTRTVNAELPVVEFVRIPEVNGTPTSSTTVYGSVGSVQVAARPKEQPVFRLLEHQQRWYDAQQQSLQTAEQLLLLCEHHQSSWIAAIECQANLTKSNQIIPTSSTR